jgi:hypothetical protein
MPTLVRGMQVHNPNATRGTHAKADMEIGRNTTVVPRTKIKGV